MQRLVLGVLLLFLTGTGFAEVQFGIINAIDRQIDKLGLKIEDAKRETLIYSSNVVDGSIRFNSGSGNPVALDVFDEEIPGLKVSNIRYYLFTDYYGLAGCYFLYDPAGNYMPVFTPMTSQVNMTFYPSLHINSGPANLIVNSGSIDEPLITTCISNLFGTIETGKVADLKSNSGLWNTIDNTFGSFSSLGKIDMVLFLDLGSQLTYTYCLTNRFFLGEDNFYYDFYRSAGYSDSDSIAVLSPASRISPDFLNSGLGIILIVPVPEVSPATESLQVTGTVRDISGTGIQDAEVQIHPPVYPINDTLTGQNGDFHFTNLRESSYTITVSKNGYKRNLQNVVSPASGLAFELQGYNHIPVIVSTEASKNKICFNETVYLTVGIFDNENGPIFYKWNTYAGTIQGSGNRVKWTPPPQSPGLFSITCDAYDYDYRSVRAQFDIRVFPNNAPVISTMTATPVTVTVNSTSTVLCDASDPDGDYLSYYWTVSTGTILGAGRQIIWQAPDTAGVCLINCLVDDGKYGAISSSTTITVTP